MTSEGIVTHSKQRLTKSTNSRSLHLSATATFLLPGHRFFPLLLVKHLGLPFESMRQEGGMS